MTAPEEHCTEEKQQEVKKIVQEFGFRTLGDSHDAYLRKFMALARDGDVPRQLLATLRPVFLST